MKIAILEDAAYRVELFKKFLFQDELHIHEHTADMIEALQRNRFDALFLDHDLYGTAFTPSGPNTGWEVANWLKKNPQFLPPVVIIHSKNQYGSAAMNAELPMAKRVVFASDERGNFEFFKEIARLLKGYG